VPYDNWQAWGDAFELHAFLILEVRDDLLNEYRAICAKMLGGQSVDPTNIGNLRQILEISRSELMPNAFVHEGTEMYHPSAPPDILIEGHEDLLNLVRSGGLKASGFESPRRPRSVPHVIPPDVWEEHIDMDQNEVWANGIGFSAVRISLDTELYAPAEAPPTPRLGRPSRAPEIQTAFQTLISEEMITGNETLKRAIELIRDRVIADDPVGGARGLSHNTIARHFQYRHAEMRKLKTKKPS
jgi:hypothetical protein